MKHKYLILTITLLQAFILVPAQNIAVKSFRVLSNDQTARVHYPVTDQNGEKCAVLKVVTTQKGFAWEGGTLGITKVENKTGEYWVYIPRGSKRITIKHDKLGVLRDYIYPEAIKKAMVYEMVLTTGIVKTIVEEREIKSQWLVVATEPEGADVYINDKHRGQTPFQQEFKIGKHTYRISKDMYHTEAGQFELKSEEGKKKMDFKLKPNYGFVNIKSSPETGAEIFIDDLALNKVTPVKTDRIKSGMHNVLLKHKWYEDTEKVIEVKDGETLEITVNMNPEFAEVTINASPDAEIFIDGKLEGIGHFSNRLMAGTYSLELKKTMYHDVTENLKIEAGESLTKQYELQPAFGEITIETKPENGAEVSIDGIPGSKITPCTFKQLPSGEHLITLRREWYEPKKIRITIEDGKNKNIIQALTPTFVEVTIYTIPKAKIAIFNADIYVDNQKLGSETYTGRIKTGIHTFEARKEKHYTASKKVEIILGNEYNISLSLIPKYGTLKVVSNPFDARYVIESSGFLATGTTPNTIRNLLIGEYKIGIFKTGYVAEIHTIKIKENQTESINVELQPGKEITINSSPEDAKLYIDGEFQGNTPQTSTLSFGKHAVKLINGEVFVEKQINVSQYGESRFEYDIIDKGTFTDHRNGKKYKWVSIGTKIWMAENLNYHTSTGSWCYDNISSNCEEYGRLYNWETAKKVCPDGWHLPGDAEWIKLTDYLSGKSKAGGKLKETGATHWDSPNTGATNESGFTALPGGYRSINGTFGGIGGDGNWWSSTEYSATYAWGRSLYYNNAYVSRSSNSKELGFSVRCVRDY